MRLIVVETNRSTIQLLHLSGLDVGIRFLTGIQTYVGIMHVNAFMAYKYEQPSNVTLRDFTEQVVGGLVAAAQLNLEEQQGF